MSVKEYKVEQELDFTEEFKEIIENLIEIQKCAIRNIEYREFDFGDFLNYCLQVPINKEKLQSIYNNLVDTIILLDNCSIMDEILKNNFYQIHFIKDNFEHILNYCGYVSGLESEKQLNNDDLLKYNNMKNYLLRLKFLNLILNLKGKKIYNPLLNYELLTPYSNELSKKLLELIKYKNKTFFEKLILFLINNPEGFKIIHYYYPYNNDKLKENALKYSNYYIYFFHNLYIRKYNFSIRFSNSKRYDIIFPDEDQDKKVNPYFIFNEINSLKLSKGSYLKKNIKNLADNNYTYKYFYFDDKTEENTNNMFKWLSKNINDLYKQSPLNTLEEIDKLQFETQNFFKGGISSLTSRIWSLIINLTENYPNIIEYLKKSCNFLEKDTIEIFNRLYLNIDKINLNDFINQIADLSFFCESSSDSILWKHRKLLDDLKIKVENTHKIFEYFKLKKIEPNEEISLIKKEIDNIKKLKIYWDDKLIETYKSKLLTLQNLIISYKNKNIEDSLITKLIKKANGLLTELDNKCKNKTYSLEIMNNLKDEILEFSSSNEPNEEKYNKIYNKVQIFIELIEKQNERKIDSLNLPNKEQKELLDIKDYKKYELLFWYCDMEEKLNILIDPKSSEKTYMELTMNLYEDSELEPILSYINEKKIESNEEKKILSRNNKEEINQMLRGILMCKLRNNKINLKEFNKIVKEVNSKFNNTEEISKNEYFFSYMISDKYSKNLKIRIPKFKVIDAFYLFYKYDGGDHFKLEEIFNGINYNLGGKDDIANEIRKNQLKYKDMINLSEDLGKLFYENIIGHPLKNDNKINICEFIKKEVDKIEDQNIKELLNRIALNLDFIQSFNEEIMNNQEEINTKFILDDFYNLVDEHKKLMDCSNIFRKEKKFKESNKNKTLFSPTFIFYLNNNQTFINELFNEINLSNKSIINDLNKLNENEKIDYLPFWLFILRNITSLNCLEYDNKDVEQNISNEIIRQIKEKISFCLRCKKPLSLNWLNLILDNISTELLEPKIHLFYYFFNSLINNLNLTGNNLNKFIRKELETYFNEIIQAVFNENIIKLLDENIKDSDNIILQFSKDPSQYLYNKIKENIRDKLIDIIDKENINDLIPIFKNRFSTTSNNLIKKIQERNKELFNDEYQKLKDEHYKKVNRKFDEICKLNSNFSSLIDKIKKKTIYDKYSTKQIFDEELIKLIQFKDELLNYKKYGVEEESNKDNDNLICYTLNYEFTNKESEKKKFNLLYKNKKLIIKNNSNKGKINIITNDLNIKLDKFEAIPQEIEDKKYQTLPNFYRKEKRIEKNILRDFNIQVDKKYIFKIFKIENEEEIKNSIEKDLIFPTENDVINPPEILLSNNTVNQFSEFVEKLINLSDTILIFFNETKNKKIDYEPSNEDFVNFEKLMKLLNDIKKMLVLNKNNFEDLKEPLKELDKEISDFITKLNKFYSNYKVLNKEILSEFYNLKIKNIFNLDFSLPDIPESITNSNVCLSKMNKDSKNLCVPIINIDSEGNNLICCYKSLDLNLGRTCRALYHKPYIINIISFVNEDLFIKIESYKETKIDKKEEKEEKEEKMEDFEQDEKNKRDKDLLNEEQNIIFTEENNKKLLTIKELVKKDENIQLFVSIPETFEEETFKINSTLHIESSSGKKLKLNVNIILITEPISFIISCKEYELIQLKEMINKEESFSYEFEQCFKLDAYELPENKEINFELINCLEKEPIEFYINAKSFKDNTSNMPNFSKNKQKKDFKITIPEFNFQIDDNEIQRLNCKIIIYINKNIVINIFIDSLIKPNFFVFKMYDFFSKKYVEDEMILYLNEMAQEIFKNENKVIELRCKLFSTFENEEFNIVPDAFFGGEIGKYAGRILKGKCDFSLHLTFLKKNIIANNSNINLNINIKKVKKQFKIKFLNPENIENSKNNSIFGIKGKNELEEDWRFLDKNEKTKFYVTPFSSTYIEINFENYLSNKDLSFFYISDEGNIAQYNNYRDEMILKKGYFSKEKYYPFSIKYKNSWFPIIPYEKSFEKYINISYENKKDIKSQIDTDFESWKKKLKNINAYREISKLKDFNESMKSDKFYNDCEKIFNRCITNLIKQFQNEIKKFKEFDDLIFENLAYHIIYNTNKALKSFHSILNGNFPELDNIYNYYSLARRSNEKEIALYNYIIRLKNYFVDKEKMIYFDSKHNRIKIFTHGIIEEQKNLLFTYYSIIDSPQKEFQPSIIEIYKRQLEIFINKNQEIKSVSKKYLIIGNRINQVNKEMKNQLEISDDELNLKIDTNSIIMILPEIELLKYKNNFSLNKIIELYNKLILGSRIFPAYLHSAIINKNDEKLSKSLEYFNTLYTVYLHITNKNNERKDNSLICFKLNEFLSSFKEMIMKLKKAGINFNSNFQLHSINQEINDKNSFITKPVKIEAIRQKDYWENEKIIEQNMEQNIQTNLLNKIEINNMKIEAIKHIDIKQKNVSDEKFNSIEIYQI